MLVRRRLECQKCGQSTSKPQETRAGPQYLPSRQLGRNLLRLKKSKELVNQVDELFFKDLGCVREFFVILRE